MHHRLRVFLHMCSPVVLLSAAFVSESIAQAQSAEQANRALAQAFEAAWNKHEMQPMDKFVTDDVDWINVNGGHGKGREQVVGGHVRVHATPKFKNSVFTVQNVNVALVRPDVAVVHVTWTMRGDLDLDGTPREPRDGVFTWVTVNDRGTWKIRASHNTNKTPIK
jgi:uncharacterized protein (TIGR02246 family)